MGVSRGESEVFTADHFTAWCRLLLLDTGEPFELQPFQAEFAADLFEGRPENWFILPEGSGKSTFLAALGLYHLKHVEDAWVPVAAASKDQARIIYRQAAGFCRRMTKAWGFRPYDGYKKVSCRTMGGEMEIFAADDRTGDGIIPTLCFLDELHRHKTLKLYETWRGKLDKRNAQLVTISTAGEPGTDFEETRERIKRSGVSERRGSFLRVKGEQLLYHEWAVPPGADVEDMAVVKAANPLSTVTLEALRRKYETPTMTPAHWRRFTCNQPTRNEYAAVGGDEWASCAWHEPLPEGERIGMGLDIGLKHDTTALVPLWIRDSEWRQFGVPAIIRPPGGGEQTPASRIFEPLLAFHARNPVEVVVMDMSLGGPFIAEWIEEHIGCEVIDHETTAKAAAADYSAFMEALREGWIKQPDDPEFTQHVLNAVGRMLPLGDTRFARPQEARVSGEQDRRVIDALWAAAAVHQHMAAELGSEWYDPTAMWQEAS